MLQLISFIISGAVFGLSGGISPGPLLFLVMAETVRHGAGAGIRVAVAPLLTDLPIILGSWMIIARVSEVAPVMGGISLAGGVFLAWLAYGSITLRGAGPADGKPAASSSLGKGVLANFLNPSPYLFWFTVGTPTLLRASEISLAAAGLFVGAFYLMLVGAKVVLALVVGRFRASLTGRGYIRTSRFLGIILLIFAVIFFRDGLKSFGVI